MRPLRILRLMAREAALPRKLERTPEPTAAMASSDSVAGFDEQGSRGLLPIYHFNALAISRLAPAGARVVDLGCGSARFLTYLARHRPDLDITGLDLAEDMVASGGRHLAAAGLDDKVRLLHGDMREFRRLIPRPADILSSIFSLHHLTSRDDLFACLREIAAAVNGETSRLWIFDHVRPRRRRTAEEVPEIFTPDASRAFRADSCNSLCASWSFAELAAALRETLGAGVCGARSRLLPLYQIHWAAPALNRGTAAAAWIEDADLPDRARVEAGILARLFRALPDTHLVVRGARPS